MKLDKSIIDSILVKSKNNLFYVEEPVTNKNPTTWYTTDAKNIRMEPGRPCR